MVFRRDQESGLLTATSRPTPSPTPVAMVFAGSQ
jgi:6-phosphogluconolactonase (cycloisomerase 2 family)